jgi:hypothetical protein
MTDSGEALIDNVFVTKINGVHTGALFYVSCSHNMTMDLRHCVLQRQEKMLSTSPPPYQVQ